MGFISTPSIAELQQASQAKYTSSLSWKISGNDVDQCGDVEYILILEALLTIQSFTVHPFMHENTVTESEALLQTTLRLISM